MRAGGSIALHKCLWQILCWRDQTFPPELKLLSSHDITLDDGRSAKSQIKQNDANTPNHGLGCSHAPSGTQEPEFDHRLAQCRDVIGRVATKKINARYAHHLLHGRVIPKTTYSMATTSFSADQCRQMNTVVDEVMLPKLRFNRHMAKAVLYAPQSRGGAAYPSFQVIQDQKGILTMLQHFRWNGTVGKDMLVVLSAIQLASGLCRPILTDVETDLSFLGEGWILHQRNRLRAMHATMWLENEWTPSLQREGDASLTQEWLKLEGVTTSKMKKANFCRLYARVTTIAELTNERGDTIPGRRLTGDWRAETRIRWPRLPRPPPEYWKVFRWCVRKAFATGHRPGRLTMPIRLDTPLGAWLEVPRYQRYQFYRTQKHAYNRDGSGFLCYRLRDRGVFLADGRVPTLPRAAHPIDARFNDAELWTIHPHRLRRAPPYDWQSAIDYVMETPSPDLAGSDGSVEVMSGDRASSACVMMGGTVYGNDRRYPPSRWATSFRSELEGIKQTLDIIDELEPSECIEQVVDNQQAVASVNRPLWKSSQTLLPEADIVMAIQHQRRRSHAKTNLRWIKAHQDDGRPRAELCDAAQLNVRMDDRSKNERTNGNIFAPEPYPGSGAMLIIDGEWVTTSYKGRIHDASTRSKHLSHFLMKHPDKCINDYNSIDWNGLGRARGSMTPTENMTLTKFMNGWLHIGYQKGLFGHEFPECPACGWHTETQTHMFSCPSKQATKTRARALKMLREHLREQGLPKSVYVPFTRLCYLACDEETPPALDDENQPAHDALLQQMTLGFEFLLRGYLVKKWYDLLVALEVHRPQQKLKQMHLGLWRILFFPVWESRNDVAHDTDNVVDRYEKERLINDLTEWKRASATRLSSHQLFLVEYKIDDLETWPTSGLRSTLDLLAQAAKNFRKSQEESQSLITSFFQRDGS